jgi:hypothetical protein
MTQDRYTHPAEGEGDPRQRDREFTDEEEMARTEQQRHVTNPQRPERDQGTSADAPGRNPADRGAI